MKKSVLFTTCIALTATLAACGGQSGKKAKTAEAEAETKASPEYTVIEKEQVDLASFPKDKDGYYVIFDGKTFNGWRGYGKDHVPSRWTIDNGAIKFNGSGGGEAQHRHQQRDGRHPGDELQRRQFLPGGNAQRYAQRHRHPRLRR